MSEAKAREIARRCVERPYNKGTVEKATAVIAAALPAEREAGWCRAPQPDPARVAEIRARHFGVGTASDAALSHLERKSRADIAYLLSLISGGDR